MQTTMQGNLQTVRQGQIKTLNLRLFRLFPIFLMLGLKTKYMLLMFAVPLSGIRSMPVVGVIIQATWHPD